MNVTSSYTQTAQKDDSSCINFLGFLFCLQLHQQKMGPRTNYTKFCSQGLTRSCAFFILKDPRVFVLNVTVLFSSVNYRQTLQFG